MTHPENPLAGADAETLLVHGGQTRSPHGETAEARWEDQGDTILLIPEGEDAQTMEGRVEGDALTFELESPETDMVMEMIWRRR